MASLKKFQQNSGYNKPNLCDIPIKVLNQQVGEQPSSIIKKLMEVMKTHTETDALFLLALSGGVDSVVLLHALFSLQKTLPFKLHALHVHHGLSQYADHWAQFCVAECAKLNVPLHVAYVKIDQHSGIGIEAEARKLRYLTLMQYQDEQILPDFILTAHHQHDQAETFLLQLFRGAGVKGLSCMALVDTQKRLLRPFLEVSKEDIYAYANANALSWCEDDSNTNLDFERNFLRHEIFPVLENRMPAINSVLSRTATHMAEAEVLLETLAEMDTQKLLKNNSLCVTSLMQLYLPRAKNVVRWWLAKHHINMPNTLHLNEIIQQLFYAKTDAKVSVQLQAYTLKRYQARAYLVLDLPQFEFDLLWQGESFLSLPNGGRLIFNEVKGRGLSLKFGVDKLRITNRKGGESFKPDANRPTRTLKHLLQEANIPPWQRAQLPLVYWQDTLAFVPLIGIAHDLISTAEDSGVEIIWTSAESC